MVVGLILLIAGFVGRAMVWPQALRVWRRIAQRRRCRKGHPTLADELAGNLMRLGAVKIGSTQTDSDGSVRRIYRFGHSLATPHLPTLTTALAEARCCRLCSPERAAALGRAVTAVERYQATDRERFRDAWRGA